MREIRPLQDEDWDAYVRLALNAYPGVRIRPQKFRQRAIQMHNDPIITIYGLFEDEEMWGAMRLYDFQMKLLSVKTLVGGVGGVAVDLRRKKEKVAFEMMQFFLRHYRKKGACLAALYPFRPNFYKQMGFGCGRKLHQYHIKTTSLPNGPSKANVSFLTVRDKQALDACYNRVLANANGMMENFPSLLDSIFSSDTLKVVGCWQEDELRGYILFQFQAADSANFLHNHILVRTLLYETTEALTELLTFLGSQADQCEKVILNTFEEDFHLLLSEPRNGNGLLAPTVFQETNVQGLGIMYRVIGVPRLFETLGQHNFGGQTVRVQLNLTDSFLPENEGVWVLDVRDGRVQLQSVTAPYDVALRLDVAEFSSLVIGAADFKTLHRYGLAKLSDTAYAQTLHRLFHTENKPICLTPF
ncbi:MAG: GNAT family N-acetyltransferase [Chloroflexi bacterium]|nr:GNAT family N-acetyltransferase [Chloroflexota bacterium]